MSTTDTRSKDATAAGSIPTADMKLEVVVIPVSDVDRAKDFYDSLGWRHGARTVRRGTAHLNDHAVIVRAVARGDRRAAVAVPPVAWTDRDRWGITGRPACVGRSASSGGPP
jgi:catechol 2,3-dioxygenase-like lactoylglutathione lyase family enzyme